MLHLPAVTHMEASVEVIQSQVLCITGQHYSITAMPTVTGYASKYRDGGYYAKLVANNVWFKNSASKKCLKQFAAFLFPEQD